MALLFCTPPLHYTKRPPLVFFTSLQGNEFGRNREPSVDPDGKYSRDFLLRIRCRLHRQDPKTPFPHTEKNVYIGKPPMNQVSIQPKGS